VTDGFPGDCGSCGYTAADWEPRDAIRLLNGADRLLDDLIDGAAEPGSFDALRRELEQLPPDARINLSDGGVPKTAVPQALVTRRGLRGDRQESRAHHGSPYQALCLWSVEVITALRAEGHPIDLGSAGENLTLEGLDWAALRPGMRLGIGEMLAETTAYSTPCAKNAQFFTGGDFRRIAHKRHPGWSRLYARVLVPGTVAAGAPVVLEP
jgi:MOSC domain-containing protein YiiM